jgi:glycine cleavage system H lipoate-binding protein
MAEKNMGKRGQTGYGSSYRKGGAKDAGEQNEIRTVLGGQVWMIKPEQYAAISNPCIWMQAGLVKFKTCNNFCDCTTCKYDQGMRMKVESGKQMSWQDAMRRKPEMARLCRHSLTNRIANRVCAYDYECATCDFDQYFEDVLTPKTRNFPFEVHQIKGFDVPVDYHFHDGHTWARVESGGYIRIGMDDFALKLLGTADAFDLPLMGKEFDQGTIGWGLKRKDNLADVRSPVGGVIVEVNSQARENPGVTNREPYGDGWLFVVRTNDVKGTVKNLIAEADAFSWTDREVGKLESMIEKEVGPLAADGGLLTNDIFGNMPALGWKNLTSSFLKT